MRRHHERARPADETAHNLMAARAQARARNRRQQIWFALATVALTLGGLGVARYFIKPAQLVFAVAPAGGPEFALAAKIAAVVGQNMRARIQVVTEETPALALQRLAAGKADLAIARSDMRIPPQARAVVIVEKEILVVAAPKTAKLKSLAGLVGKRVAYLSSDARDAPFIKKFFAAEDIAPAGDLEPRAPEALAAAFDPNGPAAVVWLAPRSQLVKDRRWEALALKPGLDILAVGGAKALERRLPGAKSESLEAGALVSAPRLPADDVDSIELEDLLVTRAKTSSAVVSQLTQIILENREALGADGVYATAIEAPDVEKDARVMAHPGAADYVNGEVQTFFDRYGDLFYIGTTVASVVGSLFVALYTAFTRVAPVTAAQLTESLFDACREIRAADTLEAVARAEGALDAILEETLSGLRDGSVSTDGFDGFRLAYERARELATYRRAELERAA